MHMSVKVKTSHLFLVLRRDLKNVGLEFFYFRVALRSS